MTIHVPLNEIVKLFEQEQQLKTPLVIQDEEILEELQNIHILN